MWVRAYRYGVPEPPVNLGEDLSTVRDFGYFTVLGRLAEGVTLAQAQAEMDILGPQLAAIRGGETGEGLIRLIPLREELTGDIRAALLLLLGAVGFVLLIACANVANLVMARSTAREREVAVRAALGASRTRLVRQLLTENVLLGVVGGVGGLLIAVWAVDVLVRMAPTGLFEGFQVGIDNSVMVFALAVSLATGVLFGVLPALQASKPDLSGSLKEGGRGGSEGKQKRRARELLVVSEVALSLMLLCGAGLLIKSMVRLQSTDVGFQTESLLVMRMELLRTRYPEAEERNAFLRDVLERVNALPSVSSAGAALALPFSGTAASLHFTVADRPGSADEDLVAEYQVVTPEYTRAMGIPLRSGRTIHERDDQRAPFVAVVNEALARWQWPGDDPIGKRISVGGEEREIVGVVGDVRHFGYDKPPRPEVYVPYYQDPWPFFALVVRTGADPAALAGVVRSQILAVDGDQPVHSVSTMEQVLSDSIRQGRFTMLLLGLFAGVAIALAVVGIYGVMSYSVNQRLHEIGIRMALGAERPEVLRLTMGWGLKLVSAGAILGLFASAALTRLMSSLLYGISATDPVVFVGVTMLLLSVAAMAALIPAQRAARFDPLSVLRHE
jgi:putative ABC transport system permease protein